MFTTAMLDDLEDVPVEAVPVDPNHIGVPLVEIAGEHEHIPHPLHRLPVVLPVVRVEQFGVEVCDA